MATALVAGRVEAEDKELAGEYIRRAGLTASDVIRTVWHNIARTGDVPQTIAQQAPAPTLAARMEALRSKTPRSTYLEELTPEALREELANRG